MWGIMGMDIVEYVRDNYEFRRGQRCTRRAGVFKKESEKEKKRRYKKGA